MCLNPAYSIAPALVLTVDDADSLRREESLSDNRARCGRSRQTTFIRCWQPGRAFVHYAFLRDRPMGAARAS